MENYIEGNTYDYEIDEKGIQACFFFFYSPNDRVMRDNFRTMYTTHVWTIEESRYFYIRLHVILTITIRDTIIIFTIVNKKKKNVLEWPVAYLRARQRNESKAPRDTIRCYNFRFFSLFSLFCKMVFLLWHSRDCLTQVKPDKIVESTEKKKRHDSAITRLLLYPNSF